MSEERLHVEGFPSLEHEVDSPADLVGKDGESLPFAVFADEPAVIVLSFLVTSENEAGPAQAGRRPT
jgi:hypothetical protein